MGLYHGWSGEYDTHADFVRGGVGVDDFEEEFRIPSKNKNKKPRKKKGCPENNFGAHIYVWTNECKGGDPWISWLAEVDESFFERNGFHRRKYKTCCGCGKVIKSSYTEEMQKRVARMGWYRANCS